jgi:type VI secretion system secreted protein VgrG
MADDDWSLVTQAAKPALPGRRSDRPLIVGSVYNAERTVPFPLPGNKTQSGLRTHSSQGGSPSNCNEFRFEDFKGSEMALLHAEKDLSIETLHNATH